MTGIYVKWQEKMILQKNKVSSRKSTKSSKIWIMWRKNEQTQEKSTRKSEHIVQVTGKAKFGFDSSSSVFNKIQ